MITPLEMVNSYKTTLVNLKRTQKLPFKVSVSSGNSTREYVRVLDMLRNLYVSHRDYQHGSGSEDMEARKCGNSSTLRGIVEVSTSSWKCNLQCNGIAKIIRKSSRKAPS